MHLTISSSPHLLSQLDTKHIMRQVIIALGPAVAAAVYFFGQPAVFIIANCVVTSIITEEVILKIRKKPSTLSDCSAVVTGLLLALILPPSTKWYAATLGAIFAVFIGKHIFGGLGANIFNPALIGRAFLTAAYPKMLTTYIPPKYADAITSATPLALRKFSSIITPEISLFLGRISGSLGETSALCLLLGGAYLLVKKAADWRAPLSLFITIAIISLFGSALNPVNGSLTFHLFSGGLMLGAIFMVTDPVTTPVTKNGRYIFGAGCGIMIMVIRYFSGLPEGVMYSILFMNSVTPLINRYTKPRRFGT